MPQGFQPLRRCAAPPLAQGRPGGRGDCAAPPLTQGRLSGSGISKIFLAQVPQDLSRPSRRGGRTRVQGETLVGVHRIETVGLFASFWSQKEGLNGRQPLPKKRETNPPPLRTTSPYTGEALGKVTAVPRRPAVPQTAWPPGDCGRRPAARRLRPASSAGRRASAPRTAGPGP